MKNKITQSQIDAIIRHSLIHVYDAVFDKATVVVIKLPSGFVLTEMSAAVDPENYDSDIGYDICIEKIKNRLWELEGYVLQKELKR